MAAEVANPSADYTLMEWNFALFFGLAVQAYEATLTTEQTIVDLLVGGIATGSVINTVAAAERGRSDHRSGGGGLPLDACIARVALNNNANQQLIATNLCTQHYAQFIHPRRGPESEADQPRLPGRPAGQPIGGCAADAGTVVTTSAETRQRHTTAPGAGTSAPGCDVATSLQAINRGMGRFFAGATGCGICHFNPEFTGATVAALTGFGAAPPPPLPPGQLRRDRRWKCRWSA